VLLNAVHLHFFYVYRGLGEGTEYKARRVWTFVACIHSNGDSKGKTAEQSDTTSLDWNRYLKLALRSVDDDCIEKLLSL
jgi:hypothetical protein